jgi:hypothetical protein
MLLKLGVYLQQNSIVSFPQRSSDIKYCYFVLPFLSSYNLSCFYAWWRVQWPLFSLFNHVNVLLAIGLKKFILRWNKNNFYLQRMSKRLDCLMQIYKMIQRLFRQFYILPRRTCNICSNQYYQVQLAMRRGNIFKFTVFLTFLILKKYTFSSFCKWLSFQFCCHQG